MSTKELKSILVIIIGILLFFAYFLIIKDKPYEELLYTALGIGLLSLLIPAVGKGIVWFWFKLAEILGWINSKILLSILYLLFLTPLSFLYRLSKKNVLNLKAPEKSTFTKRDHTYLSEDIDQTW